MNRSTYRRTNCWYGRQKVISERLYKVLKNTPLDHMPGKVSKTYLVVTETRVLPIYAASGNGKCFSLIWANRWKEA